jgi:hypothetical protein
MLRWPFDVTLIHIWHLDAAFFQLESQMMLTITDTQNRR